MEEKLRERTWCTTAGIWLICLEITLIGGSDAVNSTGPSIPVIFPILFLLILLFPSLVSFRLLFLISYQLFSKVSLMFLLYISFFSLCFLPPSLSFAFPYSLHNPLIYFIVQFVHTFYYNLVSSWKEKRIHVCFNRNLVHKLNIFLSYFCHVFSLRKRTQFNFAGYFYWHILYNFILW